MVPSLLHKNSPIRYVALVVRLNLLFVLFPLIPLAGAQPGGDCGATDGDADNYELGLRITDPGIERLYVTVRRASDGVIIDEALAVYGVDATAGGGGKQTGCNWLGLTVGSGPYTGQGVSVTPPEVLLHFEFAGKTLAGDPIEPVTFTYYICFNEPVSFHCPAGDNAGGPDYFMVYEAPGVIDVLSSHQWDANWTQSARTLNGENWVYPYNANPSPTLLSQLPFMAPGTGTAYVFGDRNTPVPAGVAWTWTGWNGGHMDVDELQFQPGRSLVVHGSLTTQGVNLTRHASNSPWSGIHAANGQMDFNEGEVTHATTGLTTYQGSVVDITGTQFKLNTTGVRVLSSSGVAITNGQIDQNVTGITSDFTCTYGEPIPTCYGFTSGRSAFSIIATGESWTYVTENTGVGLDIYNADVDILGLNAWSNNGLGLRVANATVTELVRSQVTWNGYPSGLGRVAPGISVLAGGDFRFSPVEEQALNLIAENAGTEISVGSNGVGFGGSNSTFPPSGFSDIRDVVNGGGLLFHSGTGTLQAENIYWSHFNGPPSGTVTGAVDYQPFLACSAFGDPCGGFSAGPAADGRGEGDGALIRALRAALVANPEALEAVMLVGRLAALHRLDPDDLAGERAATLDQFAVLRTRLATGPVPEALRPAAEAALEEEVFPRPDTRTVRRVPRPSRSLRCARRRRSAPTAVDGRASVPRCSAGRVRGCGCTIPKCRRGQSGRVRSL